MTITGTGPVAVTRTITNTYDPLNRLTGATYSSGKSYAYAYDAVGNPSRCTPGTYRRIAMTVTQDVTTTTVTTYTYDAANRLTSIQQPGSSIAYTWDARGNLTHDGVFTYTYNAAGRMVRAESLTATLRYTYTVDGLRIAQNVDGTVAAFAWDWATGVPELLTDGDKRYLVGHDTLGWEDAGGWTYAVPDALGSVRQAVDATAAVVAAREWTPYGVEVGGDHAGLGYTGEWFDAGVGLQYLRARWYDVATGSFLVRDAVEGNHPYQYADGNPVLYTDPSGYDAGCPGNDASKCIPDDSVTYIAERIPELHAAALTYALPWQVLAYVLESEIALDTQIRDGLETLFLRHAPCGAVKITLKVRPDPGPGLGNIHLSTAQRASQYMTDVYADNDERQLGYQDMEPAGVLKDISTTEGNIKAFGAIVKMLADFRHGSGGQPSLADHANIYAWRDVDFVAMWHGYRYGVDRVSPGGRGFDLEEFQNRSYSLQQFVDVAQGTGAVESIEASYIYLRYYMNRR